MIALRRWWQACRTPSGPLFRARTIATSKNLVEEEFKEASEESLKAIEENAQADNLALMRTPMGLAFAPMADGKVLSAEEFQALPEQERARIQEKLKTHETQLRQVMHTMPMKAYAAREKIRQLNQETATGAVDFLLAQVRETYQSAPDILAYLDGLRLDVVNNIEAIVAALDEPRASSFNELLNGHPFYRRYLVHLFVDRTDCAGAPVIVEDEPNLDKLIGSVEHRAEMGTLQTDFHLIRPGALHRANGGYLILDAEKVLTRPLVWDALKRALTGREIRIETLNQAMGFVSTITLDPHPIPLEVKIILIGERRTYYLLSQLDPDFERLFKVPVDFDDVIPVHTAEDANAYAAVVSEIAAQEALRPIDRSGIEALLWFAAREAGDRERATTRMRRLEDLLREANQHAEFAGATQIAAAHVHKALEAHRERLWRIPELMQEQILQETIDIETVGEQIGQINGLTVSQIGTLSFGRPARITARIGLGKGEVVDIEREVDLGGPLHSKGVMIISGFLRALFGRTRPLSIRAHLAFEQSYGVWTETARHSRKPRPSCRLSARSHCGRIWRSPVP